MKKKLADYEGFGRHMAEYNRNGLPVGRQDLVRLAKRYNCPLPKDEPKTIKTTRP